MSAGDSDHWLVRPRNIRRLSILGMAVLAATVLAEIWVPSKGHHGFDEWPGFAAVFGFACCVAMVLVAKVLGFVLKRREDYYRD